MKRKTRGLICLLGLMALSLGVGVVVAWQAGWIPGGGCSLTVVGIVLLALAVWGLPPLDNEAG